MSAWSQVPDISVILSMGFTVILIGTSGTSIAVTV